MTCSISLLSFGELSFFLSRRPSVLAFRTNFSGSSSIFSARPRNKFRSTGCMAYLSARMISDAPPMRMIAHGMTTAGGAFCFVVVGGLAVGGGGGVVVGG